MLAGDASLSDLQRREAELRCAPLWHLVTPAYSASARSWTRCPSHRCDACRSLTIHPSLCSVLNERLDQQKEQIVRDASSAVKQQEQTLEQLSSAAVGGSWRKAPHDAPVTQAAGSSRPRSARQELVAAEGRSDSDALVRALNMEDDISGGLDDPLDDDVLDGIGTESAAAAPAAVGGARAAAPGAPRWASSAGPLEGEPAAAAVSVEAAAEEVESGSRAADGMGSAAELRYAQAKLTVANEEIAKLRAQLAAKSAELAEVHASSKEHQQQGAKLARAEKAGKAALERERATVAEQKARLQALEKELASARQEGEEASRSQKMSNSEQRSKDVRLHRALEELEKHRAMLRELREDREGAGQGARAEAQKLAAENARLKKRQGELLLAFKKQMKLIDVLKRQKLHVEAAQLLSFTEAQLSQTLELGEQLA